MKSGKDGSFSDAFEEMLVQVIGNDHPETLGKAIELARLKLADCDESITDSVLRLESQGKLLFENPLTAVPSSLVGYFLSSSATWFWVVFASAIATTIMVFVVPETAFPLVYARYVFGGVFVLFLPGFSLIKALFGSKELDSVERLALSIGLSLALVPLSGLLLNYTPWGIRTTPVTLSLLALTLAFAFAAVARDYGARRKMD